MNEFEEGLDSSPKKPGRPVDPYRLYIYFRQRWHWFLISLAIGAVVGAVVAKTMVNRQYTAFTTLVLNSEYADRSYQLDASSLVESVLLPPIVDETLQRLKLNIPREALTDSIQLEFNLRRSSVLKINSTWASAEGAIKVANTIAKVFLDNQRQQEQLKDQEYVQKIQTDLEVASARLNNARQIYDSYRKEKGFADLTLEIQMAIEEASRLRFEAEQAATETNKLEGQLSQSGSHQEERSEVDFSSPVIRENDETTALRQELARARERLETVGARLSPDHPTVKALEAEVQRLEEQLPATRTGRRYGSIRQNFTDALRQQEAMEAAATRAKARLKDLAQDNSEVTSLLMDINVAERHVAELKSNLTVAHDVARNPTLMFRLLSEAKMSSITTKSIRKLVVIAFTLGFLVLTVVGVFFAAIRGLRVYTAKEAAYWANAPVVGSSMWPRNPDLLPMLIRDFDDYAPHAGGSTLIVPIGDNERERQMAMEIANHFNQARESIRGQIKERKAEPPALRADNPVHTDSCAIQKVPTDSEHTALERALMFSQAWTGPIPGPMLRRSARLADRVMVTVSSGAVSALQLSRLSTMLGRNDGIGILLLDLDIKYANLPDRVGPVADFWNTKLSQNK